MTIHWKAAEKYFTVVLLVFNFTQLVILENLSILDLTLSGVKGLRTRIGHLNKIYSEAVTDGYFDAPNKEFEGRFS